MEKNIDILNCNNCNHSNGVFCCLSKDDKNLLSIDKEERHFKKGQNIFHEGYNAHYVFCIHKGKIKLTKLGKDGKEQIVRLANAGEIVGYRALLSGDVYRATATTMTDSDICIISKTNFFKILENNSNLSLTIINMLSKDLLFAEDHLIDIVQKTVKERVARALIDLINSFGFLKDMQTINVTMTRAEIADMAGTTTESAIRSLIRLASERIIELQGKNIKIISISKLKQEASIT